MNRRLSAAASVLLALTTLSSLSLAGNALEFNPQNRNQAQRVTIPRTQSLDIVGQAFTMEAWIFIPRANAGQDLMILNKENHYEMKVLNNVFLVAIWTGGWAWEGAGRVELNRWTHVAATFDGRSVRNYVDGQLTSTVARAGNMSASDSLLYLGTRPLAGFIHNFDGLIDEVRVWSVIRTEAQLRANMNIMLSGREEGLRGYWRLDEGEGQAVHDLSQFENNGFLGTSPENNNFDPGWVGSEAPIRGGEIDLSRSRFGFGPVTRGQNDALTILLRNITEEDDDNFAVEFAFRHQGQAPAWLTIDPTEGSVPVREEREVTFTVDTDDLQPGAYQHTVIFESNASNLRSVDLPVTVTVVDGEGELRGRVTSAGDNRPVADALVEAIGDFELATVTREDGSFEFGALPAFDYTFRVTAADYLPLQVEAPVRNRGETILAIELLHAEFQAQPAVVELALQPGDTLTVPLTIFNVGNGPMDWTLDIDYGGGAELDPWEERDVVPIEEIVQDNRIGAVEFIGDNYYFAGGNNGQQQNLIYVLNRDHQEIDRFPQFAQSSYGMRDLTWDGQWLWGIDGGQVFGFTPEGELQTQFNEPYHPSRCIAWDGDRELLWICNVTTGIAGLNRQGQIIRQFARPAGNLHIYGLAYFPEDPDGFQLYIFNSEQNATYQVHKLNIDNGQLRLVTNLEGLGGRMGAATITGWWDPYCWTVVGIREDNPALAGVWQLAGRTDWLRVMPEEGQIGPGEQSPLSVRFNSRGLPAEIEFAAELNFTHNGRGGLNRIPINMFVTGEGGISRRQLALTLGWNMISCNVEPPDLDIRVIFQPLVEEGSLAMVKNGAGQFYRPEFDFNNIPGWRTVEGYQVRTTQAAALSLEGEVIRADAPIPLARGWQIAAYFPRVAVNAMVGFANIVEQLEIVKDVRGQFYLPAWDFSNMGDLREGQGYQLKMLEPAELVYNIQQNNVNADVNVNVKLPASTSTLTSTSTSTSTLTSTSTSSENMSVLVLSDQQIEGEVGVYTAGRLVGQGRMSSYPRKEDGRPCPSPNGTGTEACPPLSCGGIAVWGDDPFTEAIEGARPGEALEIKLINRQDEPFLQFEILAGTNEYQTDSYAVFQITSSASPPVEFGLVDLSPNPFNSRLQVTFNLNRAGGVRLAAYDLTGRFAAEIYRGELNSGTNCIAWEANTLASGLYIVRLECELQMDARKVLLLR
ncbi:MAG: LamG-like jellyroll fold domain-containing protein [Calditrichota bacterium]